ncbi:glucose dehydrogenase [FAD, quinone]-like [Aphidius gifuensis]|uniref:glucose dehydrogenase [FAD, quinone]-like n=1 Tax=Aphidius gifuensis TaxID=684658 RepID=UPI001CDCDC0F|nr:glucose dehydrogenase [FAD, quinone]-like [Aphidius gifuensis]
MQYGLKSSYKIHTKTLPTKSEYDFIVVGSGPGGSPVANRLSENGTWNVLLLEAGKPEGIFNQIPLLVENAQMTDYNWGYRVESDGKSCLGMKDIRCTWPRGKSLGGSSTINNLIHTRGNKLDFDEWANLGNSGWEYENVLKYFKKSEKFGIPDIDDSFYHNTDGNVNVEYSQWRTPLAKTFLDAGKELGYNITKDYNGAEQMGFGYVQLATDKGARCSASKAYLRVKRSNLDIVPSARVLRVLINSRKEAYGVEYEKDGKNYEVHASKEVILSAGTIDTAKLLILSGIGPKDHLDELEIPLVKDAKVGYNLQEHVAFWGLNFIVDSPVTILLRRLLNPIVYAKYLFRRTGPLSSPGGPEALAFIQTKYAQDGRPDIELLFASFAISSDKGLVIKNAYGISDRVFDVIFRPNSGKDVVTIWPSIQHPRSRGRILLKSKNPYDEPILKGNFFDDPLDLDVIVEGIKHTVELFNTKAFKKHGAKINSLKIPGCEQYEFGTDDYWKCGILSIPVMENHECGTAKMGPKDDPDAVVDPELKVYGVDRLRVIDASIMPTIPGGHITASVYMVGEKGADMIIQKWQTKS